MKASRKHRIPLVLLVITASMAGLQARTWTEAKTGRTIEGDFVKVEANGKVVIKRANGKIVGVPLERLSEADKRFVQAGGKSNSAPQADSDAGSLQQLVPPVTVMATKIKGEGKERQCEVHMTATGDRKIVGFVVSMLFLREDGSVERRVPHTQSYRGDQDLALRRGKPKVIEVSSFFMEESTAAVEGVITSLEFSDGSRWPPAPVEPLQRKGEDPVVARIVGVLGEGEKAVPAIAFANYSPQGVSGISYRVAYQDTAGKVLATTGYGHSGGEDPLIESGKATVLSGGDAPPKEATGARVEVRSVTFADESKWTPPK